MVRDKREYVSNNTKETETASVRSDGKTLYQLNRILSGKFASGKGCISKKTEKDHKDSLPCHPCT